MDSETRLFLEALFGGKPDDLYILLWTLPERQSRWFRIVEDAVRCASAFGGHDLYVGVGLARQDFGPNRRCLSDEVAGIIGVCADLDLRSDAHPKSTLPGSVEEALSILPPELPPSIVILTGNGAQAWWLFREPWIFGSDDERRKAAALMSRWHTLLRDDASQRGWTYERLSDLARVLRVPGTKNCKDLANPKPVVIHSQKDLRYNPSEFAEYLDDLAVPDDEAEASAAREWSARFRDTPITINLAARLPEEMFNGWLATDMRFTNTWFRQRHDLHDQSQSGYDLALACFGFRAGLTVQQIVDLMVHHRSMHKQKPRTRIDYFQRTLTKAAAASDGRQEQRTSPKSAPTDHPICPADPSDSDCAQAGEPDGLGGNRSKALICRSISEVFETRSHES